MSKPRTSQKLTIRAHKTEIRIANHRGKLFSTYEFKKDKGNSKKSSRCLKISIEQAMILFNGALVWISMKSRLDRRKASHSQKMTKKSPISKELQEKKYPFLDSNLSGMMDDLLENKIIGPPKPKRPEEVGNTNVQSIVTITGSLATLYRNALLLKIVSCN